jgi:7-cyano-7-deazaguanine reductase
MACFFKGDDVETIKPIKGDFMSLESYCEVESMEFNQYNESADILQVVDNERKVQQWRSHSLRSNCRVTNQPDWGDVYIHIKGNKTVTPESLLQYIVSMRKENHFHEEIAECIYKRLWDLLDPEELLVGCLYTRRGGIDINPVRASDTGLLFMVAPIVQAGWACTKTARQ